MRWLLILFMSLSLGAAEQEFTFEYGSSRYFIAAELWSNPMEGFKLQNGRVETVLPRTGSSIHSLTHQLGDGDGSFEIQAEIGSLEGTLKSTGFSIGVKSELGDYRSSLLFGRGVNAGIDGDGNLFIKDSKAAVKFAKVNSVKLKLSGKTSNGKTELTLTAVGDSGALGKVSKTVTGNLAGNIAFANAFTSDKGAPGKVWLDNWIIKGDKVLENSKQTFGPILWTQYTLSREVVKMVALIAPIGALDSQEAALQVYENGRYITKAIAAIHPQSRTAEFRLENWDDSKDQNYRVVYNFEGKDHTWEGTIRKDPIGKDLTVAGFTGNKDYAFPNEKIAENVAIQNPDVLFFSGDQIYEGVGGYGIIREPGDPSLVNYLRKYYLFGWAFRDLMKDRPSIILPDDHDVYHGNIWGAGGKEVIGGYKNHSKGGYAQYADFVNTVHRTQVSHHPDAHDPTPLLRNISVYHGDMVYGRVSFAIIADRMFKTGPEDLVNTWEGRPDHMVDKNYDVSKLDHPKAKLLGERQLKFLEEWGQDWKGADMKCVLSATIFANLANYHGSNQMYIHADLDSNGWPQTGRNKALDVIRRAYGFMYAGDQHLSSIILHGIDEFGDAGFSFCVPSIAAGYPRSWRPDKEGRQVKNRIDNLANTGDYEEGFGNKVSVYAIGNPEKKNRKPVLERLHDKASGHGLVTFKRASGEIKMECFKLLFDAEKAVADDQFPGWPRTINMMQNYSRKALGTLPEFSVNGVSKPVFQVIDESNREVLYTVRNVSNKFTPKVFKKGASYTVVVSEPDAGKSQTFTGVKASGEKVQVNLK
ncbi:MAG: alkaline phosphatase D family protein [Lentisphaerales bacterium]|nr:alkaline phosphatase D family protein [Lentisphaerales bacterium]